MNAQEKEIIESLVKYANTDRARLELLAELEFFEKLTELQNEYGVNFYAEDNQVKYEWADLPEPVVPPPRRKEWRIINGRRVMVEIK